MHFSHCKLLSTVIIHIIKRWNLNRNLMLCLMALYYFCQFIHAAISLVFHMTTNDSLKSLNISADTVKVNYILLNECMTAYILTY